MVPVGASRFRIQMMAAHTEAQARTGARLVMEALAEAREMLELRRNHDSLARGSECVADTQA